MERGAILETQRRLKQQLKLVCIKLMSLFFWCFFCVFFINNLNVIYDFWLIFLARTRWDLVGVDYKLYCEGVQLHEDVEITDKSIVGGKEVVISALDDFDGFSIATPETKCLDDIKVSMSQSSGN